MAALKSNLDSKGTQKSRLLAAIVEATRKRVEALLSKYVMILLEETLETPEVKKKVYIQNLQHIFAFASKTSTKLALYTLN